MWLNLAGCAQVPGNKAAIGQYYNAAADRYVTFDGIVKALAAEVGKEPKIMLYDESKVSLAKGEGVPFRTKHFFAQARTPLLHTLSWCISESSRVCTQRAHFPSGQAPMMPSELSGVAKMTCLPSKLGPTIRLALLWCCHRWRRRRGSWAGHPSTPSWATSPG